jgi:general secretion pathway protein C
MQLTFSERYVVALNFLLIAGCAYFGARSINDIVVRELTVIPPAPRLAAAAALPLPLTRDAYNLIVDRDIFNAVKAQAAAPPPPPQPTANDLHIKLVGTSHLSWTKPFAVFEDQNTHDQSIYRQNEQIPDAGELISVAKTSAVVNHNGTLITLEMPTDDQGGPSSPVPQPEPMLGAMPPMFGRDVHRVGPNQYVIQRSAVERNMRNMGQLFTEMRAIPNVQNGQTDGFKLSEVVPGSLFSQMGLRNGDVVQSVGDQQLNDPTQAIALLNSLRDTNALTITVMRHGRPVQLMYDIE